MKIQHTKNWFVSFADKLEWSIWVFGLVVMSNQKVTADIVQILQGAETLCSHLAIVHCTVPVYGLTSVLYLYILELCQWQSCTKSTWLVHLFWSTWTQSWSRGRPCTYTLSPSALTGPHVLRPAWWMGRKYSYGMASEFFLQALINLGHGNGNTHNARIDFCILNIRLQVTFIEFKHRTVFPVISVEIKFVQLVGQAAEFKFESKFKTLLIWKFRWFYETQYEIFVDFARLNASTFYIGRRFAAALLPRLFGKNPRSHHKGANGRVRTGDQTASNSMPLPTWTSHHQSRAYSFAQSFRDLFNFSGLWVKGTKSMQIQDMG